MQDADAFCYICVRSTMVKIGKFCALEDQSFCNSGITNKFQILKISYDIFLKVYIS